MLTKQQKAKQIKEGQEILEKSKSLVFVDFGGVAVKEIEALRRSLKELGAKMKIIKKRLLAIAFKTKKIDFNPEQFELQVGTIFAPKELFEIANPIVKSKIKILGGYDLDGKIFYDEARIKFLGRLPGREVLLGQLVGMLAAPIRMFMHIMQERAKKVAN